MTRVAPAGGPAEATQAFARPALRVGPPGAWRSAGRPHVPDRHQHEEVAMRTQDIPRSQWNDALSAISRKLADRPVHIEARADGGLLSECGHEHFMGMALDTKGSERGALDIGVQLGRGEHEHHILDAERLAAVMDDAGRLEYVEVVGGDDTVRVCFDEPTRVDLGLKA
jgi:hypothetical protein